MFRMLLFIKREINRN